MEDKSDLVRLAFRARALSADLAELDRLLNDVVAPGIRRACASLQAIQAELRTAAGVEWIDVEAGMRVAAAFEAETARDVLPARIEREDQEPGAGSDA